ncbi:MAG: hypothetical protein Q9169_001346 [Polycauliona sp. 2 TL-2023]
MPLTIKKFVPTTLSQYATLQATTTVTTTTTRDGVPVVFPIIIGPGGVALVPVGVPPPGIVPPGGNPGDDGDGDGDGDDDDDDENDDDTSTQPQTTATTSFASSSVAPSSTSSTEVTVTAIADTNPPNWEALNQIPLDPNIPLPEGDDLTTTITTSSSQPAAIPTTTSVDNPTSTSTSTTIYPTGLDVNCLNAPSSAGTRMLDCFGMLGRLRSDEQICTTDPSACLSSGDSYNTENINTSNYCMLAQSSGCGFVIANKQASFGFPGSSCVTGAQMDQFIRGAANQCAGDGRVALQVGPDVSDGVRSSTCCLVGEEGPGVCGA